MYCSILFSLIPPPMFQLTFEADKKITAMHSCEGEVVALRREFYPVGNVENWLSLLEDTMQNTSRPLNSYLLLYVFCSPQRGDGHWQS